MGHRFIALVDAAAIAAEHRASGVSIGLCHGVFDLLHPGHLRHIAAARREVDVLFVSITGDSFVNKGPGRPIFSQEFRAEALASLRDVAYVVVSPEATALTVLDTIRPNVYFKGRDYVNIEDDPTGNIVREREVVERYGGRMVFTDEIVFSSSTLINKYMPGYPPIAQKWLAENRDLFPVNEVMAYFDRLSELRVTVIGEAILDMYTTCEALGKASKEPVLCMRLGETVTHAGGSLAVAGNAHGLGANVSLVTGVHSTTLSDPALKDLLESGVKVHAIPTDPAPTIRKHRITDLQTQSRVLELYEMADDPLTVDGEDRIIAAVNTCASISDMIIVADYGHGLLTDRVIEHISSLEMYVAINAQANAGNHGYNSLAKYPRASFATMNGTEARLEARRRHVNLEDFVPQIRGRLQAEGVLVTQGGEGSLLFLGDGSVHRAPAFAHFVRDRVGAGDALLTITAMLMYLEAPPQLINFIGNIVGSWAVSFLGNEERLDIGTLRRQVVSILK